MVEPPLQMPIKNQVDLFSGSIIDKIKLENPWSWVISIAGTKCFNCGKKLIGNAEIGGRYVCWDCIAGVRKK